MQAFDVRGRLVKTLIDGPRAEALYADMGPGVEVSGGSAVVSNTIIVSTTGASAPPRP